MDSKKITVAAAGLAALCFAAAPAEAQYRRGWSPGAAAAVGVLGGLAVGSAIAASSRPAYGPPPPAYYGPPPAYPAYGECYVVHRRVWVPGYGWDMQPREVCD